MKKLNSVLGLHIKSRSCIKSGPWFHFPKLTAHQGNREHIFGKKADLFYKTRLKIRDKNVMIWAIMGKDFFYVLAMD